MMKRNITLVIDESILSEARRMAVEKDTTVNGLVREYLKQLTSQRARKARFRKQLTRLLDQVHGRVGEITWTRDQLHDR